MTSAGTHFCLARAPVRWKSRYNMYGLGGCCQPSPSSPPSSLPRKTVLFGVMNLVNKLNAWSAKRELSQFWLFFFFSALSEFFFLSTSSLVYYHNRISAMWFLLMILVIERNVVTHRVTYMFWQVISSVLYMCVLVCVSVRRVFCACFLHFILENYRDTLKTLEPSLLPSTSSVHSSSHISTFHPHSFYIRSFRFFFLLCPLVTSQCA